MTEPENDEMEKLRDKIPYIVLPFIVIGILFILWSEAGKPTFDISAILDFFSSPEEDCSIVYYRTGPEIAGPCYE